MKGLKSMTQADSNTITRSPADSSRRRFLTVAAAASAVSATALAAAAMPVQRTCAFADDSELLKFEKQIFEQREGAAAFDEEIDRLRPIWMGESKRLYEEVVAGRLTLTGDERWAQVGEMPECIECSRLERLQGAFHSRMDALVEKMFATPAHTPEGRRAKVTVLLSCIMSGDWTRVDAETDYPELTARRLLIEFIGGEPGEQMRGQFA
jgi:hypothetical protein